MKVFSIAGALLVAGYGVVHYLDKKAPEQSTTTHALAERGVAGVTFNYDVAPRKDETHAEWAKRKTDEAWKFVAAALEEKAQQAAQAGAVVKEQMAADALKTLVVETGGWVDARVISPKGIAFFPLKGNQRQWHGIIRPNNIMPVADEVLRSAKGINMVKNMFPAPALDDDNKPLFDIIPEGKQIRYIPIKGSTEPAYLANNEDFTGIHGAENFAIVEFNGVIGLMQIDVLKPAAGAVGLGRSTGMLQDGGPLHRFFFARALRCETLLLFCNPANHPAFYS
jgi:hypothetical protein